MITVCSIFRNSAHYIDRYLIQAKKLSRLVDLRLVLTYGDCTDTTAAALDDYGQMLGLTDQMDVARFDHGGPRYGSVDHPERWDQIAKVVRFTLDRVGDPGDALVWVESDLVWKPDALVALVDDLSDVPAIAPRLLAHGSSRWYDTWGYRKDGAQFLAHQPYVPGGYVDNGTDWVKIDSCGSCFVTRETYWRGWSGHWPYTAGGDLWYDPDVTVEHP